MNAAIGLTEWFIHESDRVYQALAETEEATDARRLEDCVARLAGAGEKVTPREFQRTNSKRYPTADAARIALDSLAGSGQWEWRTTRNKAGAAVERLVAVHDTAAEVHDTISETPGKTNGFPGESGNGVMLSCRHAGDEGESQGVTEEPL
jgi:hypothetical protein